MLFSLGETTTPKATIPRHNLLPQPTPFIGRQEELTHLDGMLSDPDIRLITIVAPGGMGKTRLAITCGEQQLHLENTPFQDGVFLIPFAQVHEADRLVYTIAEAIHLQIKSASTLSQSPKEQLLHYLRRQQMLLLVDNFEHLILHANLLREILQNAAGVKLLITSRERLNIQQEHIFVISGLPSSDKEESPEIVPDSPAGQLFIQSAQRFRPDFQIFGDEQLASLSLICHLVGGMPLALELAAGWVDLLSLAEIAAEIHRSLDFLETDLQDVPIRQRGIRAVFDTTWERLDQNERDVFLRFSVFKGGCTRWAAQTVTGASLQTLASLVRKSLIQVREGDGRYLVHELMRQYAAEKLAMDTDAEAAVQSAHCAYYCTALEKWDADLRTPRQSSAVTAIQADYQNIQAAWDWAVEKMDLRNLALAARGLYKYFEISYRLAEAEKLFPEVTLRIQTIYGQEPKITEATKLLIYLLPRQVFTSPSGVSMGSDYVDERIEKVLYKSLALLQTPALAQIDTRREEAFIRLQLGMFAQQNRNKNLEKSWGLYEALGDLKAKADSYYRTNWYPETVTNIQELLTENLAQLHEKGDPESISRTLISLGDLALLDGNFDQALQRYDESYTEARSGGHIMGMANARRVSQYILWHLGDFDRALKYQEEAIELCHQSGNTYRVAYFLGATGLTEVYRGQYSRAIALLEKATSFYQPSDKAFNYSYSIFAFAYLHAGHFKLVRDVAIKDKTGAEVFGWPLTWDAFIKGKYTEVVGELREKLLYYKENAERCAWLKVILGITLHNFGQISDAKKELYESLTYSFEGRTFIPLMHLMPIIPVVLAAGGDQAHQERALELYAMAKTLPFVANSKLFEDIAERPLQEATADLPRDIMRAARVRGQKLDWWETAAVLLDELRELGWAGSSE